MPRLLVGSEKNYDWGDEITIRHTMGLPSTRGTNVAELWLGTHHLGPTHLDTIRGPLMEEVTGPMHMLVKLIACAHPLSLQTHPTSDQARAGFAREEAAGIPIDAPHRMYKDPNDKPEMVVALSRFEALCGFRDVDASVAFLASIGWQNESEVLDQNGIDGYMLWAFDQQDPPGLDSAPDWLKRIAAEHPGDPALRVAPLLHHVVLKEGQAISLPAGNLHAYIRGFGLEVMGSSDNVVRAGFTSKHVDVTELLRIVDTTPIPDPVRNISPDGTYESPSPKFSVGTSVMLNGHVDCHRVVYGNLRDWNPSDLRSAKYPEAVLVPAGEETTMMPGWAIVCTQLDA